MKPEDLESVMRGAARIIRQECDANRDQLFTHIARVESKLNSPGLIAEITAEVTRSLRMPADGKSVTVEDVKPVLELAAAQWELNFERHAENVLQRAIDRMPTPKDGLGFEDLTMEQKGDRTVVFVFRQGERQKRFEYTLPMQIYRGMWRSKTPYVRGDAVTYGASLWHCEKTTMRSPGASPEAWTVMVPRAKSAGEA